MDFHPQESDTPTFYTDGVVEAQNEACELYGFERVSALVSSGQNVHQIVEAACAFGQNDHITVLWLTRLEESAPADAARLDLAAQIAALWPYLEPVFRPVPQTPRRCTILCSFK